MSDANIEAHGLGQHKAEPKWSCPVCLLDWAALVHRDLNVPQFDRRRLANVAQQLERERAFPRRLDHHDSYVYTQFMLSRERAIRAVIAAQWQVAIVLVYRFVADVAEAADGYERGAQDMAEDLERFMLTPEQIVDR